MIEVDFKSMFRRLNRPCTRAMEGAVGLCVSRTHYELTVEHLLLQLLEDPRGDVPAILQRFEVDMPRLQRGLQRSLDGQRSGNPSKPVFSQLVLELVRDSWLMASINLGLQEIRSGTLLLTLAGQAYHFLSEEHAELAKIQVDALKAHFQEFTAGSAEEALPDGAGATGRAGAPGGAPAGGAAGDGALARFAVDFTARAREGKIDPVFGRDREIRQAIDILARRRKNNPIMVGDAGVGKTAVVEGFALRIAEGDVPDMLKEVTLYGLDMGLLQAGAGVKGEFENRLRGVIEELKQSPKPTILFIDEAHTLIGAGGAAGTSDAANLLKPALARGELRTIAATTWAEYKKYFEEDAALARRFQLVKLDEPSADAAALMLRGLKSRYEAAHSVQIRDEAVEAAAQLSARYIAGRQLPDKAVDLLDTAAARVKISLSAKPGTLEDLERLTQALERQIEALDRDRAARLPVDEKRALELRAQLTATKDELARAGASYALERAAAERVLGARAKFQAAAAGEAAPDADSELDASIAALKEIQGRHPRIFVDVGPDVVAQVVEDWTGIPVGRMVQDEAAAVLDLESRLKTRIKGQDHAMAAIAQAIRAAKAGLQDPGKPQGVFLLVGPSGVGKTETALTVADFLYGGERFVTAINMSEYQDREMGVSGLVGAKPGYVGYGKGGTLTEGVRQRPYSVVLLDEIEKAAQEVRNLFYQVFDKGDLTDGTGRQINFKNTIIFVTSNLGSDAIQALALASPAPDPVEILASIRPALSKALQPAWLARCTVIPFLPLRGEALAEIARLKVEKLARRMLQSHRLELVVEPRVAEVIADRCSEVETGARNIDFILQGTLLPRMSSALLEKMSEGRLPDRLMLGVADDGDFTLNFA